MNLANSGTGAHERCQCYLPNAIAGFALDTGRATSDAAKIMHLASVIGPEDRCDDKA